MKLISLPRKNANLRPCLNAHIKVNSIALLVVLSCVASLAWGQTRAYINEDWETPPYFWTLYMDGIAPETTIPGYAGEYGWYQPVNTNYSYGDVIPDPTPGLWQGIQGRVGGVTPFTPVPATDPVYNFTNPAGDINYSTPYPLTRTDATYPYWFYQNPTNGCGYAAVEAYTGNFWNTSNTSLYVGDYNGAYLISTQTIDLSLPASLYFSVLKLGTGSGYYYVSYSDTNTQAGPWYPLGTEHNIAHSQPVWVNYASALEATGITSPVYLRVHFRANVTSNNPPFRNKANFWIDDIGITQDITYNLVVLSLDQNGDPLPGFTIYRDTVDTGQATDYVFSSTDVNDLIGSYTLSAAPAGYRWEIVSIPVVGSDFTPENGYTYTITFRLEEDPLPVELAGFLAMLSVDNFVNLTWVTQSETGVLGFYLLRNTQEELDGAVTISELIPATNTSSQQTYVYKDDEISESCTYYYWLQNVDLDGTIQYHGPVSILYSPAGYSIPGIPLATSFDPVYPNPFNPQTNLPFSLAEPGSVSFEIYNARGQLVRRIETGEKSTGHHQTQWDGLDSSGQPCTTGVYNIRMTIGSSSYSRKAVLLK